MKLLAIPTGVGKRVLAATLLWSLWGILPAKAEENSAEKPALENRLQKLEELVGEIQADQLRLRQLAEKLMGGMQSASPTSRPIVRRRGVMFPLPPAQEVTGEFQGHRYRVVPSAKSWSEADAFARQQGGYLVVIASQEEQDYVETLLRKATQGSLPAAWIGLRKNQLGEWQWVEGENSTFLHWREGEPNNLRGNENRAHLGLAGDGKWNDQEGSVSMYSIIEYGDAKK